jgi:hypothetical protein
MRRFGTWLTVLCVGCFAGCISATPGYEVRTSYDEFSGARGVTMSFNCIDAERNPWNAEICIDARKFTPKHNADQLRA